MTAKNVQLPKEASARRVRADAISILVMGVLAAVAVLYLAVQKYLGTFVPGGIYWELPVERQAATATGLTVYRGDGPSDAATISGTFSQLQVVVPGVNTVSVVCLTLAIATAAIVGLAVVFFVVRLAWLFQRGRFFTLSTSRALRALTWIPFCGGLLAFMSWKMGANGVEAALNARATADGTFEWWSWYWILLFAVTASGLIDIALRRAIRLQHETEGLV